MSVVVTLSARETFTPHELTTAYKDFTTRGPQYLEAETDLKLAAYRFGGRGLIVCEEPTGVVVLYSPEWRGREVLGRPYPRSCINPD